MKNMFADNYTDTKNDDAIVIVSSGFILNLERFSHLHFCASAANFEQISQTKPLKIESFLPSNFVITKICVRIRLAEDGTRMGGI